MIKANNIIQGIRNSNIIKDEYITSLDYKLLKHPYFQIGQILLAKGLLNNNSIRYNQQLKKAAAYCINRKKLFNLITLHKNHVKKNINIIEKKSTSIEKKSVEEELNLNKPLLFYNDEKKSFSEWLTLVNVKKIKREDNIIDDFIKNQVKIKHPTKEAFFKATDNSKESLVDNQDLITPTLARVYLEQGHYDKAIKAYEKLSLKYPKKNTFFANQIKLINKLNKK